MNRSPRTPVRAGFTLVELLVVIAIIGVLVSLLLPAVNAARESARKMQCSNNLHNLAIACLNYHDSLNSFPNAFFWNVAATDSVCGGTVNNCEEWGWNVLILPYIEQQNLHNALGVLSYSLHHVLAKQNPGVQNPKQLLEIKLPVFICPSDSNSFGDVVPSARDFRVGVGTSMGGLGNFQPGVSNYMASRGTDNRAVSTLASQDSFGVFMETFAKRMQDITDGSSNTIMLGERDTQICNSGTWIGVVNPSGSGSTGARGFFSVTATEWVKLNSPDPPVTWNSTNGCLRGFSSLHPGGANFALCDGSVRFITNGIEFKQDTGTAPSIRTVHTPRNATFAPAYSVYTRLGRRNDGFPVGDY